MAIDKKEAKEGVICGYIVGHFLPIYQRYIKIEVYITPICKISFICFL